MNRTQWEYIRRIQETDTSSILSVMSAQDFVGTKIILSDLFYGQLYVLDVVTGEIVQTLAPNHDLVHEVLENKHVVLYSADIEVLDFEEAAGVDFFGIESGSVPPIRRPMYRAASLRSTTELDVLTTVYVPCYKKSTEEYMWLQCIVVVTLNPSSLVSVSSTILDQSSIPYPAGTGFSANKDEWYVVVHNLQAVGNQRLDSVDIIQRYTTSGQRKGDPIRMNSQSRSEGYKGGFFFNPVLFNGTHFLFCSQRVGELHVAPKEGGYTHIIDLVTIVKSIGVNPETVSQYFSPIRLGDGSAMLAFRTVEDGKATGYSLFLDVDADGGVSLSRWSKDDTEYMVGNAVYKESTGAIYRTLISPESEYYIGRERSP